MNEPTDKQLAPLRPQGNVTIPRAEYDALLAEAQAARVLRTRVATLIDMLPSVEVYGWGRQVSRRIEVEINGFTLKNATMRCINHDDVVEKIDRLVLLWKQKDDERDNPYWG